MNWPKRWNRLTAGACMARDITEIIGDLPHDGAAQQELFERVYHELKQMAQQQMRRERDAHTLQSTALVHEAYLRLSQGEPLNWQNRRHFFAAAAESMRRILVESARARKRQKRGGGMAKAALDESLSAAEAVEDPDLLLDLEQRLEELQAESRELAELVQLRFFAGLSMPDVAACLEISLSTAERRWRFARAWLLEKIG